MTNPQPTEDGSRSAVTAGTRALAIRPCRSAGTCVIELSGRLDGMTRDALAEQLERTLEADTHVTVLDLRDLEFIDPAGVRTILTAYLGTADQLEEFLIIPGPEPVQRVIDRVQGPFRYISQRHSLALPACAGNGGLTARGDKRARRQPRRPARRAPWKQEVSQ
jgi:anti-anti-sigma factor